MLQTLAFNYNYLNLVISILDYTYLKSLASLNYSSRLKANETFG